MEKIDFDMNNFNTDTANSVKNRVENMCIVLKEAISNSKTRTHTLQSIANKVEFLDKNPTKSCCTIQ